MLFDKSALNLRPAATPSLNLRSRSSGRKLIAYRDRRRLFSRSLSSLCIFSKTRRWCPTFGTRVLPPCGLPLFFTGFWLRLYLVDISSVSRRRRSKLIIAPVRNTSEQGISRSPTILIHGLLIHRKKAGAVCSFVIKGDLNTRNSYQDAKMERSQSFIALIAFWRWHF